MAKRSILFAASALLALTFHAPKTWAVPSTAELIEEEKAGSFPLGATIIFDQSIAAGTFIQNDYERRPSYALGLTFLPTWRVTDNLVIGGRLDIQKEVITNAGSTTTKNRETTLADVILGLTDVSFYRVPDDVPVMNGFNIGGTLDFALPTSKESRFATKIMTVRGTMLASYPIGPVRIDYNLRGTKSFNRYSSPVVQVSGATPVAIARARGAEELAPDLIAVGGNNIEWSILNRLAVTWDISQTFGFPERELALAVDYSIINRWAYTSYANDELTAENAKSGRGRSDLEIGIVEASVKVVEHVYLALGVNTYLQPPKSANNKTFRAPFFNFQNGADNYTSVYFDVIAVF